MSRGRFFLFLAAVAVVQLILAAWLTPVDDELYYWCWSKQLQASYFDHPPVTAYMIGASTAILGDTLLGVRLFACLCSLGTLALIGVLTDRRGVYWLLLTPAFAVGSILMTPDAPLLFFWTAYAVWLVKMQDREQASWRQWFLGGLLLGLGGLSKYTMVLAVPGAFLAFLLAGRNERRPWLWGFAFHLIVSLAVVSPVLIYNFQHNFAPLRWQLAHASGSHDKGRFDPILVLEYVAAQVGLFGMLPFLLLPWCIAQRRQLAEDNRLRVCLWLFLFPSVFFLIKAFSIRVQGNWPFIGYMTVLPLALRWWDQLDAGTWKRWSLPGSFAIPAALTAIILLHLALHLPLPASTDRLTQFQVRFEAARKVSEWAKAEGADKIYATSYQLTSHLRFQHVDARQLPGQGRPSEFSLRGEKLPLEPVIYVYLHYDIGAYYPTFNLEEYKKPWVVARFPEKVSGSQIGEYVVLRYERLQ